MFSQQMLHVRANEGDVQGNKVPSFVVFTPAKAKIFIDNFALKITAMFRDSDCFWDFTGRLFKWSLT